MGKRKRGSEYRRNVATASSKRTKLSAKDEDYHDSEKTSQGPLLNALNGINEDIQAHPSSPKQQSPPHELEKGHVHRKNATTPDKGQGKRREPDPEPVTQLISSATHKNHEASISTPDQNSKSLSKKKKRRLSKQSKRNDGPLQASPPAQSMPASAGHTAVPKEADSKNRKKNRRRSSQGQGTGSALSAQAGSLENRSLDDEVEIAAEASPAEENFTKRHRWEDSNTAPANQNNSIPAANSGIELMDVREDISGPENDEKQAPLSADSQDEYARENQREDDSAAEKSAILPEMNPSSRNHKKQRTETDAERAARIAAKKATRTAKQERRREKQQFREINKANPSKGGGHADQQVTGKQSRRGKPKKKKPTDDSLWDMVEPEGGYLPGLDLGFGDNEKSVLVAFNSALHVYTSETSLLLRKLRLRDERDLVAGFAFSARNPDRVYIGTRAGFIDEWNWREGKRLGTWHTRCLIRALATVKPQDVPSSNSLVYTSDEALSGEQYYSITAHRLFGGKEADKTGLKTLWKNDKPVQSLTVLDEGKAIVAASGETLLLGTTAEADPPNLGELKYTWRQISCSDYITSMDVRLAPLEPESAMNSKKVKMAYQQAADIVVGTLQGHIYIYRDLLGQLTAHESSPSNAVEDPQKIHWHRNAVSSVKWSKDGNYLISGGLETVIVLHQLSTGRQQFLPNLMAPIASIVVSPSGTSYGINLADNSAMIISTTELKPTFSIAGLRLGQARSSATTRPNVATIDSLHLKASTSRPVHYPSVIHPLHHSRLLAAVPASLEPSGNRSNTFLQTFDIPSATGLTTQALTRTTATTKDIAPDATSISTPDVTHISLSSDGHWLATIDTWAPPVKDLEDLAYDTEEAFSMQSGEKEVYLKFWSQNPVTAEWELSTRIDNPHAVEDISAKSVLALACDSAITEFATLAIDGSLRFWASRKRIRDGQPVTDDAGRTLTSWKCAHTMFLTSPSRSPEESRIQQAGYLTYSTDGTVLAAGYHVASPQQIFVVNAVSGEIANIIVSLNPSPLLLGVGMLSREVVLFHPGELEIHDLVDSAISYISLPKMAERCGAKKILEASRIAVDAESGLVAVGFPDRPKEKYADTESLKTRLQIFNTGSEVRSTPEFEKTFYNEIAVLLPSNPATQEEVRAAEEQGRIFPKRRHRKPGFIVIDHSAQVYTLTRPLAKPPVVDVVPQQVPTPPPSDDSQGPTESSTLTQGPLASFFRKPHRLISSANPQPSSLEQPPPSAQSDKDPLDRLLENENDDLVPAPEFPVVSAEKLAEVFDNATHAGNGFLPPVDILYEEVMGLFTGMKGDAKSRGPSVQ